MKQQIATILLIGSVAFAISGCTKIEQEEFPEVVTIETESEPPESEPIESEQETGEAEEFSFAAFKNRRFSFLSGAGGWATYLTIAEDGSFFGEFFDGELGITGEDYPNGTMYQCHFQGKFTQPVKVNEYTYSMQIAEISYEKEIGTEEIIDGMLYCYITPYGLDGANDILIYAPGTPLAELSEEYRSWVGYYDLSTTEDTELPFWGLYNVKEECGFGSYDMIDWAKESVAYAEENAADLEKSLENDPLTQTDYNEKSQILYANWDYALNCVWDTLKQVLSEEEMNVLIIEEREWISEKEKAIEEAVIEVGGGSIEPLVRYSKAAELTKARVYELLELLE